MALMGGDCQVGYGVVVAPEFGGVLVGVEGDGIPVGEARVVAAVHNAAVVGVEVQVGFQFVTYATVTGAKPMPVAALGKAAL